MAQILRESPLHVRALTAVAALAPRGGAIGAGFIRNLVWDHLAGLPSAPRASDVDVVFYDPFVVNKDRETAIERQLTAELPLPWQVRNQARMHVGRSDMPFGSLEDAVASWPETATAVAARLLPSGSIEIVAPHGLNDLLGLIVRAVPGRETICRERWKAKRWQERWPVRLADPM